MTAELSSGDRTPFSCNVGVFFCQCAEPAEVGQPEWCNGGEFKINGKWGYNNMFSEPATLERWARA